MERIISSSVWKTLIYSRRRNTISSCCHFISTSSYPPINPNRRHTFRDKNTYCTKRSITIFGSKQGKINAPCVLDKIHGLTDRISTNIPIAVVSIFAAVFPSLLDIPNALTQVFLGGVYVCVGVPSVMHNVLEARGGRENAVKALTDVHTLMTLSAFSALAIDKAAEGAFLLGLFQLAHAVEHRTVARAEKDVKSLATLVPDEAQVVADASSSPQDKVAETPVQNMRCSEVPVGSVVMVRPHSVCPLDGMLLSDTASVNVAHITGESSSVAKRAGGTIPAGAVNASTHAILIKTTKTADQSALQRIVALAQSAARSRPHLASLVESYMPYYTASVLLSTAGIGLASTLIIGCSAGDSLYYSLSFLVAASPCALLVASPVAQAAAVSSCSRHGIVLSGGVSVLERFATARTIALDKTGTITEGHLKISGVHMLVNTAGDSLGRHDDESFLMQLAAALAKFGSRHPVSQAIAREVQSRLKDKSEPLDSEFVLVVDSVVELPGRGVKGVVKHAASGVEWMVTIGRYYSNVGSDEKNDKIPLEGSLTSIIAESLESPYVVPTATGTTIGRSGLELRCVVSLTDTVRAGVKESLQACPLPTLMLTGDNHATALTVGSAIGMDSTRVFSQLTPEDKATKVESLDGVLMVGDGINDAPALAAAPAGGIAVASPSSGDSIQSAAVSVADAVILITDEEGASGSRNPVEAVNFLILKSQQTQRIVKQNVGIALISILGTASLVVVHGCPLWMAVLFHEGSTVLVVLNGLRNLYP